MPPRIPRFTLYSGPNCSLCDAELAKVRKLRPFELNTINIQDPGQERWKKKYVYWIPALHLDGKEIAKGRWDSQTRIDTRDLGEVAAEAAAFFVDLSRTDCVPEISGIYMRNIDEVLGATGEDEDEEDDGEFNKVQRCFNCGSPEHPFQSCPFHVNRELVSLTRTMSQFFQGTLGLANWQRIHEVEAWRQQRLDWLEEFELGEIRSPLLREALGRNNDEWLKNIAIWGYPKGWFSVSDPRDKVRERIWNENGANVDALMEDESFFIYSADREEPEEVSFRSKSLHLAFEDGKSESDEESDDDEDTSKSDSDEGTSDSSESSYPDASKQPAVSDKVRWAKYPDSHFAYHLLPIYTGMALPPIDGATHPPSRSATYTQDRQRLWQQITSGAPPPPPGAPPPGAPPPLPPPPPDEPPPPLPPSFPSQPPPEPSSPPPPPPPTSQVNHPPVRINTLPIEDSDNEDSDMDMSD